MKINVFFKFLVMCLVTMAIFISCAKKPLTLDEQTSMKTLLKASDEEITELVVSEIQKQKDIADEKINVEYVLRDEKSQTIVVKTKIADSE